jgi:hypothetical protein
MGYQKEIALQGQSPNVHVQGRIRELSVTELFAKLSRTERQIFD